MFLETKREGEAKTAPTLDGLIAWLEQQPADGSYDFGDPKACAAGRYYKSIGANPEQWITGGLCSNSIANQLGVDGIRLMWALSSAPRSFGGALNRLRTLVR